MLRSNTSINIKLMSQSQLTTEVIKILADKLRNDTTEKEMRFNMEQLGTLKKQFKLQVKDYPELVDALLHSAIKIPRNWDVYRYCEIEIEDELYNNENVKETLFSALDPDPTKTPSDNEKRYLFLEKLIELNPDAKQQKADYVRLYSKLITHEYAGARQHALERLVELNEFNERIHLPILAMILADWYYWHHAETLLRKLGLLKHPLTIKAYTDMLMCKNIQSSEDFEACSRAISYFLPGRNHTPEQNAAAKKQLLVPLARLLCVDGDYVAAKHTHNSARERLENYKWEDSEEVQQAYIKNLSSTNTTIALEAAEWLLKNKKHDLAEVRLKMGEALIREAEKIQHAPKGHPGLIQYFEEHLTKEFQTRAKELLCKVENADTFDNAKKSHSLKKVDCDGQQKASLSPASLYGAKPKSPTGKAGDGNTYKYSASS